MRHARRRGWHYYLAAHLLSLTGWTMAMARFPALALEQRLAWFILEKAVGMSSVL
jgi:hypothetical protein